MPRNIVQFRSERPGEAEVEILEPGESGQRLNYTLGYANVLCINITNHTELELLCSYAGREVGDR